jgi:hypothetical protein
MARLSALFASIALVFLLLGCVSQPSAPPLGQPGPEQPPAPPENPPAYPNQPGITSSITTEACAQAGGSVVNTLGSGSEYCPAGKEQLGVVEGMDCPCVCCK